MNYPDFFEKIKELDSLFQEYFEKEEFNESVYQSITDIISFQKMTEVRSKFKILINLMANIVSYHRVGHNFEEKFEKIIQFLDIFKTFTPNQIFKFFRFSRRSLYYFFRHKLITPNDNMLKEIIKNNFHYYLFNYIPNSLYTYKQCGYVIHSVAYSMPQNSQELLEIGENNFQICSLIRKDLVEEFVTYVSTNNFQLNTMIPLSYFETNPFLCGKSVSLIQYAAFFGSIQIFQYLKMNSVYLDQSLWEFAIHGQSPEIIHLLEENRITLPKEKLPGLIEEAIKCHYSNIATYLINKDDELKPDSFYRFAYTYYNFEFFLEEMNYGYIFLFACDYDYIDIAKDIIQEKGFQQHEELIFNNFFFLI